MNPVDGRIYEFPLPIGTMTPWGQIQMIGSLSGERYYWMVDEHKAVSMFPADAVEPFVAYPEATE